MKQINRVLIIDDDDTCIYLAKLLLKSTGMGSQQTLSAKNGKEGLDVLKIALERGEVPELILLDIKMPIMDGFTFLEEFSKLDQSDYSNLKIVLLSSSQNPWEIEKAKKFESVRFLHKPLNKEMLLSLAE